jgi:hypothetical protein
MGLRFVVLGLKFAGVAGVLVVVAGCGPGVSTVGAGESPLPVFTAPPSTQTSAARTMPATKSPVAGQPRGGGSSPSKLPRIPVSALPQLSGYSYDEVSGADVVAPPKIAGQPRILGEAFAGIAKGKPSTPDVASLELIRMDPSLSNDPVLTDLVVKIADKLGGSTSSSSSSIVGGVKVVTVSNLQGAGLKVSIFRRSADIVMIFSLDSGPTRQIAAAYIAAT